MNTEIQKPVNHSLSSHGSILQMPEVEPWPDAVDGCALLDELVRILNRCVILPKWAPETIALWILHTYAFQLRDVTTYLGIESPEKRCGKTTLLSLLHELAHRVVASSNISPPAFFRVIEDLSPTLLIDEVDTFLAGNDQLRGILNAGYKRKTAFVLRTVSTAATDDAGAESSANPGSRKALFLLVPESHGQDWSLPGHPCGSLHRDSHASKNAPGGVCPFRGTRRPESAPSMRPPGSGSSRPDCIRESTDSPKFE